MIAERGGSPTVREGVTEQAGNPDISVPANQ